MTYVFQWQFSSISGIFPHTCSLKFVFIRLLYSYFLINSCKRLKKFKLKKFFTECNSKNNKRRYCSLKLIIKVQNSFIKIYNIFGIVKSHFVFSKGSFKISCFRSFGKSRRVIFCVLVEIRLHLCSIQK